MKTLITLSAFVLPLIWVAAPPAHADSCDATTMTARDYAHCVGQQNDPNYYDQQRQGQQPPKGVCADSGAGTAACQKCMSALGAEPKAGGFQAGWACGVGGRDNWYTNNFPCSVMGNTTGRDGACDGDLEADGIHPSNGGEVQPLAGKGPTK